MTSSSGIRLTSDLCASVVDAIQSADWDAAERGDMGTDAAWTAEGAVFDHACRTAVAAVDPVKGIVRGEELADCLELMAAAERHWGDAPQTAKVCRAIARLLAWEARTVDDLCSMLRMGEY